MWVLAYQLNCRIKVLEISYLGNFTNICEHIAAVFWLKCVGVHISENICSVVTHYLSRVKDVSNTHYTENMFYI